MTAESGYAYPTHIGSGKLCVQQYKDVATVLRERTKRFVQDKIEHRTFLIQHRLDGYPPSSRYITPLRRPRRLLDG